MQLRFIIPVSVLVIALVSAGAGVFSFSEARRIEREIAVQAGQQIRTPLLLLQAGADQVVSNEQQLAFCEQMRQGGHPCAGGQPVVIAEARHELLNESDEYRIPALNATLRFFEQQP